MGTQEMRRRRVAVLYTHALFGQGIARLLQTDGRLKVTCLRADLADTTEQLKRLRPHAIVMERREERLPLREIGHDLAPALFIEVHFEDNLMDIYHGRQMVAASPETLVEAICSASPTATMTTVTRSAAATTPSPTTTRTGSPTP